MLNRGPVLKSPTIFLAVLAAVFFSGLGMGLFLGGESNPGSRPQTSSSSTSPETVAPKRSPDSTTDILTNFHLHELEGELSALKKNQAKLILADRLALFKKYHESIRLEGIAVNDLHLTPALIGLLELSPAEQEAIKQHLATIHTEMAQLQDDETTVTKQTADTMTLEIPTMQEGQAVKSHLMNLLAGDVGQERAEVLMYGGASAFSYQFADFGEQSRHIEITKKDEKGQPLYMIAVQSTMPNRSVNTTVSNSMAIPPDYAKFLPPNPKP